MADDRQEMVDAIANVQLLFGQLRVELDRLENLVHEGQTDGRRQQANVNNNARVPAPRSESRVHGQRRNLEFGYKVFYIGDGVKLINPGGFFTRYNRDVLGVVTSVSNKFCEIRYDDGINRGVRKQKDQFVHVDAGVARANWRHLYG
jgi:hypothetical protein